jgi:hypothetical protein
MTVKPGCFDMLKVVALSRRSSARDAGGMAKPLAKLLSMLTPKRR